MKSLLNMANRIVLSLCGPFPCSGEGGSLPSAVCPRDQQCGAGMSRKGYSFLKFGTGEEYQGIEENTEVMVAGKD